MIARRSFVSAVLTVFALLLVVPSVAHAQKIIAEGAKLFLKEGGKGGRGTFRIRSFQVNAEVAAQFHGSKAAFGQSV